MCIGWVVPERDDRQPPGLILLGRCTIIAVFALSTHRLEFMAQDYIMRLLQQVAAMLAGIIAKKRLGLLAEARQELEETCLRTVGLPLDRVKRLSPDELAEKLRFSGALRYTRAVMLAELLIQDAEILESKNEAQQALASYIHAFCLLSDSLEVLSTEEQAIYGAKLEILAGKIDHLPPNPYTTQKLLAYRARINAERVSAPNGSPAKPIVNSGVPEGPPSVR